MLIHVPAFLRRTASLLGMPLWAGLLLLLGLAGGCGGHESPASYPVVFSTEHVPLDGVPGEAAYIPVLDGPLRPLAATPLGEMVEAGPATVVSVTFSRPMVPLGEAPEVPPEALVLSPPVPGTLRWVGTQILVFEPATPLPPATAFRATVAAGLQALDGTPLEKAFTWTFETPRPRLVASEPADGARYADPARPIRLTFNQPLAIGRVGGYVQLVRRTPERMRVPATLTAGPDSTVLVLTPAEPLRPGTSYEIHLRAGLPAAGGPLGMAGDTVVRFTTYGPLVLEAVTSTGYDRRADIDPARGLVLTFSNPVRFGDLRHALTVTPPVVWPPGLDAQDDRVSTTHTLPPVWAPETPYTLELDSLPDTFGQVLDHAAWRFRTRPLAPAIRMPQGLLVIEASARAALPVHVTNLKEGRVGLQRVGPDDIVPLLPVYDHEHYYGEAETQAPAGLPAGVPLTFPVERNRPDIVPFPLDSYLTDSTGIVAVHLEVPPQPGWRHARSFRALVQVTRLGLTAKFSPHQNLVFVTELATARPVSGARVTLRDATNRVRWEGHTDEQGRALTPGWATLGLTPPNPYEAPTQYVIVEHGGDVAFTSSLFTDGLEPYRFDVDYAWWPEPRTDAGSVFTDRGLYRAGETVHLKGILRTRTDADWQPITDSIRLFIESPRDERVLDRYLRPGPLGTFDLTWEAPPGAALGVYTVRVAHAGDTTAAERGPYERGDIARGSFRVDAFRTATFSVTARTAAPAYIPGDFFEGTVTGHYLFGAAMRGQPVRFVLTRTPATYAPPGYPGYRFGLLTAPEADRREIARGDTLLDDEGRLDVRLPLPGDASGGGGDLVFEATVTDPARQEIAARTVVPLHPGLFYIGLKPATTFLDLSRTKEITVDVATVDPAGHPVAVRGLTVEVIRQQWHSVREVGVDGRLHWRSERTEEPLGTQQLDTRAGEARRLHIPIDRGGSYLIRASGTDLRGNVVRTEAFFYATGAGYVAWARADDDRIDLVPERTTYRPGETARFMVASPFERATALITVERDGILSSRVETLVGSAPQIEIPLTEAHLPNVFVSVILLHGRTAPPTAAADAGAPAFKVGYAGIRVDPGVRHLSVEVLPERAPMRPGEEATVTIQVRDAAGRGVPAEVTFAAVDAGVLNLLGYHLPDPFDAFYGPQPLRVLTSETRARLVRQRNFGQKEEDLGGGGGTAEYMLRQDFRPLAHWVPSLQTDAGGRATVRFTLPQSLTTFRLMAVAVAGGNRFGAGRRDLLVTQPLVLQPALPRFARRGDRFEAGVLVSNRTDRDGRVVVTARAEGLTLTGPASHELVLAPGATREVRFGWAAEHPDTARITFEASMANVRDALQWPLPVRLPTTRETSATFASTEQSTREVLRIPADALPGLGHFSVRLASTALAGLDGATRYLFQYPYGCLEQRTSRIRPLLLADNLFAAFDLNALHGDRNAAVQAWLDDLPAYWTGDGFALWPGGRHANPYVSAYVVLALAEARAAGYALPERLLAGALDALEQQVRNPSDRPAYYDRAVWNDTRTLMLYALVRHGRLLEDEAFSLAEALLRDPRSSVEGQSLMLRTVVRANSRALATLRPRLLDRLRSRVRVEGSVAYFSIPPDPDWGWVFASDTRATALGMTALIEADPTAETRLLAERMLRFLMSRRTPGHWGTTQENVAAVEALATYFASFEKAPPDFVAELRVDSALLLREAFRGSSLTVFTHEQSLDTWPPGSTLPVEIRKTGPGRLYYSLLLETYRDTPLPARDQGLRVARTIQRLDKQGHPVGRAMTSGEERVTLQAGDLVRVTLRLSSPAGRHYVVVDDPLPAGLEALNAAFETTARDAVQDTGTERWWGSFTHTELHDDRVLLFADYLQRGEHTYTYVARATTPGTFVHPPARGEMMYEPSVYGHTPTGTLVVQPPPPETARR